MLKEIEFGDDISKEVYKPLKDELVGRLVLLQQQAISEKLPIIVVFEGWGSAGKGERIGDLMVNLDARSCRVIVPSDSNEESCRYPFMQGYWFKVGPHGTMTIFDRSWYHEAADLILRRARAMEKARTNEKKDVPDVRYLHGLADVGLVQQSDSLIDSMTSFEKQFADDGYLIVKFFLHITKEEQERRLNELLSDERTSWRVTKKDLRRHKHYDELFNIVDGFLERTSYTYAPWHVVPSLHARVANLMILRTLVDSLQEALDRRGEAKENPLPAAPGTTDDLLSRFQLMRVPSLDDVTYDHSLQRLEYEKALKVEQKRLARNHNDLYRARIPLMLAFEGWDAAGKGGNIKRIASALDARGYQIVPSASPTPEEKAHPFLWRYWRQLPRTGHVAIYDRTWYGRVLVERVEGFASTDEWRRAYEEINEFEWEMQRWGAILLKFWIDVSPDEQLRRFKERQEDASKQWKITEEDWRNRDKNPEYRVAVNDMVRLTSTEYAPWHIIESDDKLYARIKTLRLINDAVEQRLFG